MAVAAPAGRGAVRERGPDPGRRGGDAAERSSHPPGRNGARHARYLPGSRPARPAHVSRRLRHRAPGGGGDGSAGGRDADPGVRRCGTGGRDGPPGAGARRRGAEGRDRDIPGPPGDAATARRQRPAPRCRWTIALWAADALGSLLAAVDPDYSVREIRSEVGYALVAFVAFLAWTRSERRLRLECLAVLVGFAAISSSALLGAYLRNGVWPAEAYYGDVGRVSSYLVTVGPVLGLTVALFGRRHPAKWLVGLGVPFLAVALLCAERALWPALGVQAAAVCVWAWRVRPVAVGPLRLALAGLLVLGLVGGGVYASERYRTGGDPQSPMAMENDARPRVWKKVGEEILENPWTGDGLGSAVMSRAYPDLLPADESEVFWHPHNLVLTYGISAGVPGMVAVLAL